MVYEDACQAVFGRYKGRYAGTLATAGGFSFDAEKTMGSDVGGCILTDDDALAERARFIGQSRAGEMVEHFGRVHTANGFGSSNDPVHRSDQPGTVGNHPAAGGADAIA